MLHNKLNNNSGKLTTVNEILSMHKVTVIIDTANPDPLFPSYSSQLFQCTLLRHQQIERIFRYEYCEV